jgi:PKD domain-containing protein
MSTVNVFQSIPLGYRACAAAPAPPKGTMKKPLIAAAIAVFLLSATGSSAVTRPAVQPGQSWNAACLTASPGDVIPVAPGNHPSQSISCKKAAPGVTFQASGRVIVGNSGASENCLSVSGTSITVTGVETTYYGTNRQCGVAIGRGSQHVTFRNVDAGHFWIAGDDASIVGGDYGPTLDKVSKFSERTCAATNFTCMPKRPLIDGAYIHDHRRGTQHMECLAFYGGTDAVIRNSRFHNCSVFHIFISASQSADFKNILIEGNQFSCAEQAVSNAVKFSNHGFKYSNAVMRNNTFACQETFVASSTASQLVYEGNSGGGLHMNNGGPKPAGSYQQGATAVTVRSGSASPPPPPPPPPPPSAPVGNAAPTACFTRTPNPSRAKEAVMFNAFCSTDPDGDTLTYAWDIGPAGDGVFERTGMTTSYTYQGAGSKTARLHVNDGHGNVVTTTQTFTVNP